MTTTFKIKLLTGIMLTLLVVSCCLLILLTVDNWNKDRRISDLEISFATLDFDRIRLMEMSGTISAHEGTSTMQANTINEQNIMLNMLDEVNLVNKIASDMPTSFTLLGDDWQYDHITDPTLAGASEHGVEQRLIYHQQDDAPLAITVTVFNSDLAATNHFRRTTTKAGTNFVSEMPPSALPQINQFAADQSHRTVVFRIANVTIHIDLFGYSSTYNPLIALSEQIMEAVVAVVDNVPTEN